MLGEELGAAVPHFLGHLQWSWPGCLDTHLLYVSMKEQ